MTVPADKQVEYAIAQAGMRRPFVFMYPEARLLHALSDLNPDARHTPDAPLVFAGTHGEGFSDYARTTAMLRMELATVMVANHSEVQDGWSYQSLALAVSGMYERSRQRGGDDAARALGYLRALATGTVKYTPNHPDLAGHAITESALQAVEALTVDGQWQDITWFFDDDGRRLTERRVMPGADYNLRIRFAEDVNRAIAGETDGMVSVDADGLRHCTRAIAVTMRALAHPDGEVALASAADLHELGRHLIAERLGEQSGRRGPDRRRAKDALREARDAIREDVQALPDASPTLFASASYKEGAAGLVMVLRRAATTIKQVGGRLRRRGTTTRRRAIRAASVVAQAAAAPVMQELAPATATRGQPRARRGP